MDSTLPRLTGLIVSRYYTMPTKQAQDEPATGATATTEHQECDNLNNNLNNDDDISGLVTNLNTHDILMGRGATSSEYVGNNRLRKLVLSRRDDYAEAPNRKQKHGVAVEVIETVYKNGGRFLRRIEDGDRTP